MTSAPAIRSMTGFSTQSFALGGTAFVLELRSVNGRHGDVRVRLPWPAPLVEAQLSAQAREAFHRARLDILLRQSSGEWETDGCKDMSLARVGDGMDAQFRWAYGALTALCQAAGMEGQIRPRDVLAFLDLTSRGDPARRGPPPGLVEAASGALAGALVEWNGMRDREGAAMVEAVVGLFGEVEAAVMRLETIAAEQPSRLASRMRARVESLLGEMGSAPDAVEAARLAGEIALAVDRADVKEELVRIRSHLDQVRETLHGPGPHGRKLDFFLQELHREINTTGAKAADAHMGGLVVEIKAVFEKIREIIQNVE